MKKLKLVPDVQANGVPVYVARASSGVTGSGRRPSAAGEVRVAASECRRNDKRRVNHCSFSSGRELTRRFRNSSSVASRSASLSTSARRHRRVAAGWVYRDLSRAGSVPWSVCADPLAIRRKVSCRSGGPSQSGERRAGRLGERIPSRSGAAGSGPPAPPTGGGRTMIRADGAELNARASFDDVAA